MSDAFDKSVDMIARCNAEIKSLRKGNRGLQLHFDVLKADYDRLRHEVGRLQALISDAKEVIDADDAITAYRILDSQPAPNPWRPIETAPKDGTEVLMVFVFEDGETLHRVVWWDSSNLWAWPWRNEYTGLREQDAKAWMPLPLAPGDANA